MRVEEFCAKSHRKCCDFSQAYDYHFRNYEFRPQRWIVNLEYNLLKINYNLESTISKTQGIKSRQPKSPAYTSAT